MAAINVDRLIGLIIDIVSDAKGKSKKADDSH